MPATRSFQTTRWTMVRTAVAGDDADAPAALAAFCAGYWFPIYAYIRRSGASSQDAEDLTQGFFARLLEKDILAAADPGKGKLRTFLLSCVRHFLADDRDRAHARKRGLGLVSSLDAAEAEERYAAEPVDDLSPDRLFQRRWALGLLGETHRLLGEEWAADGKGEIFTALRPFLGFDAGPKKSYEEISAGLGVAAETLRSHVHRLRKRWRELLLAQVAATLDDPTPENVRDELSELLGVV
jgi:DNA-directed RNA polymerase specialized sigma24 family protein